MLMNKAFNKHSNKDRLYLLRTKGGKVIISIQDFCERMCVSTLGYVLQSSTVQGKTIKEHYMNKKEKNLMQQVENIVDLLELNVRFTFEGRIWL